MRLLDKPKPVRNFLTAQQCVNEQTFRFQHDTSAYDCSRLLSSTLLTAVLQLIDRYPQFPSIMLDGMALRVQFFDFT